MSKLSGSISKWMWRLLILVLLAGGTAGLGAIAPRWMASGQKTKHLTHTLTRGDLSVMVTENGAVESSNNKEIKCMVKGGSTVLWVIETGTIVKPGDELGKLDQSQIEVIFFKQKTAYENAMANKITAESDVAVAKTSITEYLEGTYQQEKSQIQKEIFEAEQSLRKAELSLQSDRKSTRLNSSHSSVSRMPSSA